LSGLDSQIDSLKVIIVELQVQPFEATKQVNEHEIVESFIILKSFKLEDLRKIWLPHKMATRHESHAKEWNDK
jgi:hypothetical protein